MSQSKTDTASADGEESPKPEQHIHNHTHYGPIHGAVMGCFTVIERMVYLVISIGVALFFLASQEHGTTLQVRSDCVIFRVGVGEVINIDTCSTYADAPESAER